MLYWPNAMNVPYTSSNCTKRNDVVWSTVFTFLPNWFRYRLGPNAYPYNQTYETDGIRFKFPKISKVLQPTKQPLNRI